MWRLHSSDGRTAILKAAALRDDDWPGDAARSERLQLFLNESTALEFLTRRACAVTPRFIGADAKLGFVLMEDLGDGLDVASLLLGSDASTALAALCAWAEALADLHIASHARTREYEELRSRAGAAGSPFAGGGRLAIDLAAAADRVQSTMRVSYDPTFTNPPALRDAVKSITRELGSPQWQVVSPHDCCPDNNVVLDDGGVRLFDFQFAGVRHALLDLAVLHTIMPNCWCAGRLPAGVVRLATERYRRRLARSVARAKDEDAFKQALASARAGLALQSLIPRLIRAADATGGDRREMPGYDYVGYSARQLALLRLDDLTQLATERALFEPLGTLAAAIRPYLVERFGPIDPVGLYPAFARFGPENSRAL